MIDVHVHTRFSSDGREDAPIYVAEAKRRGISIIGFSDHCDYDMLLAGDPSSILDTRGYFAALDKLDATGSGVKILRGVELGYAVGTEDYYKKLLNENPFDYAIISVHGVSGRGDCYYPAYFDGLDKRDAFMLYLGAVRDSVRSGIDYQILGHIGYIARYAPYPDRLLRYEDFSDVIDDILSAVIERGAALELNTSCRGIDAVCITHDSIIERYIALGGKNFSFGSDAHSVDRYADKHDEVKNLLLSHGIEHTVHFENRRLVKDLLL